MVIRRSHLSQLEGLLQRHQVVAILGARQVGKTTLARQLAERAEQPVLYLDLEDPEDLAALEDPKLVLQGHRGLVILDEIQRMPELFPLLRVLADRPDRPARFLILGSASPDLLRATSESLAGRIAYHRLGGFSCDEVGSEFADRLWLRGGFPRSYLAESDAASLEWRQAFIQTFLERDLPQLGIRIPAVTLHRFWTMLAHYHAQVWNGAELARAFGVSESTVRSYLDILTGALVLEQIAPWHENISKRQVRSPKVYLGDPGLLHALLGIETADDLMRHPKVGASWEGFALAEIARHLELRPEDRYFWATYTGAELDLLVLRARQRLGFEIKRTTTPKTSKSMHSASETLALDELYIVHAGSRSYPMRPGIKALALGDLGTLKPR
jgi:uncharacterized protein